MGEFTRTKYTYENLPQDLILDILLRVPVTSLLCCKCVCKSWLTLISSHKFAHDRLRQSMSSKTDGIVVLLGNTEPADDDDDLNFSADDDDALWVDEETKFYEFYLYSFDLDSPRSRAVKLPMPRKYDRPSFESSKISIIGCCNGILCITYPERVVLLNPTIKTFFEIPKPHQICYHYGDTIKLCEFGYDCVKDDYKLFMSITAHRYSDEDPEILIYSFNSNSWRVIGKLNEVGRGWYVKAVFTETHLLHWSDGDKIACFNIRDEQWSQLPLPNYYSDLYVCWRSLVAIPGSRQYGAELIPRKIGCNQLH